MAPVKKASSNSLQVPISPNWNPFYVYANYSTSDLESNSNDALLLPRILDAQSIDHNHTFMLDRPHSSQSLPSTKRFRKCMKETKVTTEHVTTSEEFDALPLATRRKYFSTLERLRLAQENSTTPTPTSLPAPTLDEVRLPIQKHHRKSSLADRRGLHVPAIDSQQAIPTSRRRRTQKLVDYQLNNDIEDFRQASWFEALPEKIKRRELSREEQVVHAERLRKSEVLLDAADEAVYCRRASRYMTQPLVSQRPASTFSTSTDIERCGHMITTPMSTSTSAMADAMYESFRWMDEEEDINLKLVLDDYHANLDGFVVPALNSNRRPSFRRTMSITKMPFGRNSLSSIQHPRSPKNEPPSTHTRQKSRTLSIIGPKHAPHDSISSIDPNATHYQDPEARLKLRVYLASPQKFDEAIEFGFPSMDGVADGPDKENKPPQRQSKDVIERRSHTTDRINLSFLNDDAVSLDDDDASMVDPDSPVTPMGLESGLRPGRASPTYLKAQSSDNSHVITKPTLVRQPDSYAQSMAGSREMTMRMTLTRPDLRADDNTIYGWQTVALKSPLREEPMALEDVEEKYEIRGPLGGVDGWEPERENGVVKRFWNKVKSQRKTS